MDAVKDNGAHYSLGGT